MLDNDQILERLRQNGFPTKGKTGRATEKITGIRERWYSDMTAFELALESSIHACENARQKTNGRFRPEDLRLISSGGSNPDDVYSACACKLQAALGIPGGAGEARDVSMACSTWVDDLRLTDVLMRTEGIQLALVVTGEPVGSRANTPNSIHYTLFGDGSAAAVIEYNEKADPHYGILATRTRSDGQFAHYTKSVGVGGAKEHFGVQPNSSMEGYHREIQEYAVNVVSEYVHQFLDDNGVVAEVPYLLPHNGNLEMISEMAAKLGLPPDRIITSIRERANTSSASVPINLVHRYQQGLLKDGDLLLMVAFGAGMSMSFCLYRWISPA